MRVAASVDLAVEEEAAGAAAAAAASPVAAVAVFRGQVEEVTPDQAELVTLDRAEVISRGHLALPEALIGPV